MASWRQEKRQMHRDVHVTMGVPALLLRTLDDNNPISITIRGPHAKRQVKSGDLSGGGEGWAEREDIAPRICVELSEIPFTLTRGHIVSVEPGEAYRVDTTATARLGYLWVNVIPLTQQQADGLALPDAE